jgi:hypothetical protein
MLDYKISNFGYKQIFKCTNMMSTFNVEQHFIMEVENTFMTLKRMQLPPIASTLDSHQKNHQFNHKNYMNLSTFHPFQDALQLLQEC